MIYDPRHGPPELVRRGDWRVPRDDLERAESAFNQRSERSRRMDKLYRAPITTSVEHWERMRGRGVDYPGVDTPTDSPDYAITDVAGPRERARMGSRRDRDRAQPINPDFRGDLYGEFERMADRPFALPSAAELIPARYR